MPEDDTPESDDEDTEELVFQEEMEELDEELIKERAREAVIGEAVTGNELRELLKRTLQMLETPDKRARTTKFDSRATSLI